MVSSLWARCAWPLLATLLEVELRDTVCGSLKQANICILKSALYMKKGPVRSGGNFQTSCFNREKPLFGVSTSCSGMAAASN